MALLVAYCGESYYGLQMNRSDQSLKTIEREFFLAVTKSKLVLPNCATEPSKMSYKCASRTDKACIFKVLIVNCLVLDLYLRSKIEQKKFLTYLKIRRQLYKND